MILRSKVLLRFKEIPGDSMEFQGIQGDSREFLGFVGILQDSLRILAVSPGFFGKCRRFL